jgi:magnesium chelatase subunit D
LREDLAPGTPWRRVPLGIADDRLLGGLDLAATLRTGTPVARRGLLAEADGGVLILAMAERVAPGVAARIAATMDLGAVSAERDGFSHRASTRFGVVALDEGQGDDESPATALLDRLAFWVDLAPVGVREIGEREVSREAIDPARSRLASIGVDDESIAALVGVADQLGVASLRAPLLALRAARAAAALRGGKRIEEADIALAAALTLAPRATRVPEPRQEGAPEDETPPPEAPPNGDDSRETHSEEGTPNEISAQDLQDLVLAAAFATIPPNLLRQIELGVAQRSAAARAGKAGANMPSKWRGRPIGARRGALREGRLGLVDTLRAAAPWQKIRRRDGASARIEVRPEDFRIQRFRQRRGTTAIFVVDASGSAAMQRLAEVKGTIELLLVDCYVRRDSVALVAFRGKAADIILPPTRSLARAKRTLAAMPGGGGTPIANGLEAALNLAETIRRQGQSPLLVLMTDGRANVGRDGAPGRAQALEDALRAGRRVRAAGIAALAIDTAPASRGGAAAPTRKLAEAMSARYLQLPSADSAGVSAAVRAASAA